MTVSGQLPQSGYRISSIDILRGIVMIIMALDHTRDFFHVTAITADPLNPAITTVPLYFTRWITHFCAPIFVFLSGISAYLSASKKTKPAASAFLLKRGIWLVIVEITLVTFGLTFNPFFNIIILQVIWAIGMSMIFLALMSRISHRLVFILGILLVLGHNLLNLMPPPQDPAANTLLQLFLTSPGAVVPIGSQHFLGIFYAILPWTGIMFIGFGLGKIFEKGFPPARRTRLLLYAGLGTTAVFIALRFINMYGNPQPAVWGDSFRYNLLVFLNTSKYPPSLQYTCMTIGPALVLLALLETARGRWVNVLSVYGKVPFFYYILHFYLIHSLLVIVFFATGRTMAEAATFPFMFRPADFGFDLPMVYVIWLAVVAALYYPCRWFSRYKATHRQWWLPYL